MPSYRATHLKHGRRARRLRRGKHLLKYLTVEAARLLASATPKVITIGGAAVAAALALDLTAGAIAIGDKITIAGVTYNFKSYLSITTNNDVAVDYDQFATAVLTTTGNAVAAETVTIGGVTYTWRAAIGATANEVLVGVSASASLDNLIAAVNLTAGAGSLYGSSTVIHPTASAAKTSAAIATFSAKTGGTGGNALASTDTMTLASFGGATFSGGRAATLAFTLAYLVSAITNSGNVGKYQVAGAHALVTAGSSTNTLTITALVAGLNGNLLAVYSEFANALQMRGLLVGGALLESVTCTAHGLLVGAGPFAITAATTLPGLYTAGTLLFVSTVVDANTLKFRTARKQGSNFGFSNAGVGALALSSAPTVSMLFRLLRRLKPRTLSAAADIDTVVV